MGHPVEEQLVGQPKKERRKVFRYISIQTIQQPTVRLICLARMEDGYERFYDVNKIQGTDQNLTENSSNIPMIVLTYLSR